MTMTGATPIVVETMGCALLPSHANMEASPSKATMRNPMSFHRNGVMGAQNASRRVL